ncbi:winged helix-turn-helix transcriptional regulator [Ornithinibacillus gellani]|uniref:ArsR/SmtB family transcription factor n=1 Tax=Ornithinibacillus gellani TaxID=2293253 RepID=UPI000F48F66E|nr:metalloregulator ArsR/SmtB family transcription factor [Ornithinibacillus gellani]TQS76631.1 winged helix-turn-helix transcriptional regulator [Ornithinibacillus gellani]
MAKQMGICDTTLFDHEKSFKALSDQKRLHILRILATKGRTFVCDLGELLGLPQSKLSYHLKILLDMNFISVEKEGKWNYYSANSNEIKKVLSSDLCCLFYPE